MNVILLHRNHRHASATHVAIFGVVITDTETHHQKLIPSSRTGTFSSYQETQLVFTTNRFNNLSGKTPM